MGGIGSGTPEEGAIVKLSGEIQHSDGSISKTKMFEFLNVDLDNYDDIELTAKEAQNFTNHVKRMKTGMSAFLPKLCPGRSKCHLKERCPFNKPPISRACPLEVGLIKSKTREYIDTLDIDPGSPYEMSLIDRLVELDVFEYRANLGLATIEDQNLIRIEFQETKSGQLVENAMVNPYITAKEGFHRKRMNLLEALVATRKEEYKKAAQLKKKDSDGISSQLSDVRSLIEKMNKAGGSIGDLDKLIEGTSSVPSNPDLVEADWEAVSNDDFLR
jgi:hypothetical protein